MVDPMQRELEMRLRLLLTGGLMEVVGFEGAKQSKIVQKLRQMKPSGGTAMRDALLTGIGIILELN